VLKEAFVTYCALLSYQQNAMNTHANISRTFD